MHGARRELSSYIKFILSCRLLLLQSLTLVVGFAYSRRAQTFEEARSCRSLKANGN